MRRILYGILVVLVLFAPVKKLDVAKLEPIRSVAMSIQKGQIVLETDGERKGKGATVMEALENLKANTPAVVYLDTAEYLLVAQNAWGHVNEMLEQLKKDVTIAPYYGTDVKEETEYVESHMDAGDPTDEP